MVTGGCSGGAATGLRKCLRIDVFWGEPIRFLNFNSCRSAAQVSSHVLPEPGGRSFPSAQPNIRCACAAPGTEATPWVFGYRRGSPGSGFGAAQKEWSFGEKPAQFVFILLIGREKVKDCPNQRSKSKEEAPALVGFPIRLFRPPGPTPPACPPRPTKRTDGDEGHTGDSRRVRPGRTGT